MARKLYSFNIRVLGTQDWTDTQTDDFCESLFSAGAHDITPCSDAEGLYLVIDREAETMEIAIREAITQVRLAGGQSGEIQMDSQELMPNNIS